MRSEGVSQSSDWNIADIKNQIALNCFAQIFEASNNEDVKGYWKGLNNYFIQVSVLLTETEFKTFKDRLRKIRLAIDKINVKHDVTVDVSNTGTVLRVVLDELDDTYMDLLRLAQVKGWGIPTSDNIPPSMAVLRQS